MYPEQNIHQLIIRLFAGEANSEEKKTIEAWLNDKPENRKLFDELKEIWLSSGIEHNPNHYDVEKAILQFRQKTRFLIEKTSRKQQPYRIMRYAAILLLAAALPFSYYYGKQSILPSDAFTTITCALGDKTSIVLPDSSRVFLNSGSKLTFNTDFKNGSRRIFLDGEAFFKVRKDPHNPFRVKTSAIEVEVLGTQFNLEAYSNEPIISTTLVTGSLKVTGNNRSAMIKPNQKLVFDKETRQMKIQELADLSPETDWKDGRLVFGNQSLGELKHDLERWFDVDIHFADEQVKSRRFTGTLERESILEVISYFGRSKYVAYHINDNVITFYTKH
jgi:ferric-dicitrate binding protein FerR (iron transport regulator)